ncbi:MAG TPA: hypothetical protein DCW90_06415 [Lachnospiraceae bacterium]|nr:hypothetical protein [uncultured Lachnoclostridium sp.]HAU85132.1 hypothetical protein [Lachnospiraceae bacterium]
MITIVTKDAHYLSEYIIRTSTPINVVTIGSKLDECSFKLGDTDKSVEHFEMVFRELGLSKGAGTTKGRIELIEGFHKDNVVMIANLIEQLYDGYQVENNIGLLKRKFEEMLKAGE